MKTRELIQLIEIKSWTSSYASNYSKVHHEVADGYHCSLFFSDITEYDQIQKNI